MPSDTSSSYTDTTSTTSTSTTKGPDSGKNGGGATLGDFKNLFYIALAVGPHIGYVAQLLEIAKTHNYTEGYSALVSLILVVSNTLRIYYYPGAHYAVALLVQSCLGVLTHVVLLAYVLHLKDVESGITGRVRDSAFARHPCVRRLVTLFSSSSSAASSRGDGWTRVPLQDDALEALRTTNVMEPGYDAGAPAATAAGVAAPVAAAGAANSLSVETNGSGNSANGGSNFSTAADPFSADDDVLSGVARTRQYSRRAGRRGGNSSSNNGGGGSGANTPLRRADAYAAAAYYSFGPVGPSAADVGAGAAPLIENDYAGYRYLPLRLLFRLDGALYRWLLRHTCRQFLLHYVLAAICGAGLTAFYYALFLPRGGSSGAAGWAGAPEVLGYASLFIEALLVLPQIIKNMRQHSTRGLTALLILTWVGGDAVKLVYYIVDAQPTPFIAGCAFQIFLDLVVVAQIIYYRWCYRGGPSGGSGGGGGGGVPPLLVSLPSPSASRQQRGPPSRRRPPFDRSAAYNDDEDDVEGGEGVNGADAYGGNGANDYESLLAPSRGERQISDDGYVRY